MLFYSYFKSLVGKQASPYCPALLCATLAAKAHGALLFRTEIQVCIRCWVIVSNLLTEWRLS